MADIDEVAENIYLIDNQLYSIPKLGCAYLINEEKKALVETGTAASAGIVLDGVRKVGVRPEDIDYIIVTHIHLDHAGGAGVLLKDMPQAKVVVHYKGARHLANPTKLINSMREAQGEEFLLKSGEMVPIASGQILAIHEGDTIALSDKQVLRFIDAPGHAPHELCIYETRSGGVFTGDAAGSPMSGGSSLLPLNTPPSFDLEQFISTIKRLMELHPTAIYYSHFGVSNNVQHNLEAAMNTALAWDDIVTRAMRDNRLDTLEERMEVLFQSEIERVRNVKPLYEFIKSNIAVSAAAYIKYHQDKQQASQSG